MRLLLTGALILPSLTLTGGTALASSITPLTGHGGNGSIVAQACEDCPPVKPRDDTSGYTVPVLDTGSQKTEIVEINGEKKLLRTEAWLGGSPVVHVSKVHEWTPGGDGSVAGADGIDHEATVGAVHAGMSGTPAKPEAAAFDPEAMVLRLD